jgi:BolA protein
MSSERINLLNEHLRSALAPQKLEIIDDSAAHRGHSGARNGGRHFRVLIVSEVFSGKTLLQRHRLVYKAVEDLMPEQIHALSIKAFSPDEL